ncbi:putative inositol polyphosphate multikinase [Xylogone sp. PMI_703]|nr:putative inositol polyphosphate multikinase [Xylogone sp. PMI_703]
MTAKQLPSHSELINYNYAVAGHDGTLSDVDGELFIKPCTRAEVDFYETSVASYPQFAELMPTFLGTLELGDQHNAATIEEQSAALISKHTIPEVVVPVTNKRITTNLAVVLENAAHGFVRPNILDVKLGVRLWADDAHPDKKQRFDKVTEETTHKELGFRIAGMRVWQGVGAIGKAKGKAKADADIDEEGYKIYDKNYGRYDLDKHNVADAFRNFIFNESAGIDEELGRLVAQAFHSDLRRIQKVLEEQESRMFSASLLFVFEGDGVALRAAMEEASKSPATLPNDGDGESDQSEDDDELEQPTTPKIYTVKVIDFAHAFWTPGNGPDENSLLGVRSVANILESLGGS